MNCNEIKSKLFEKDAELKAKKDKTIEIFELIKKDCLDLVIEESIERNFEYLARLRGRKIIDIIKSKLNLNFDHVLFDDNWIHGVEHSTLTVGFCDYGSMLSELLNEEQLSRYGEMLDEKEKQHKEAMRFVNSFDWALLCTMLRSYIINNGFDGVVATHRYTGDKCNFLEFKTTRAKLLSNYCCENKVESSEDSLGSKYRIAISFIFPLLIGIILFICLYVF